MIVGLGNPGKEYDNTRHNVGFACLDELVAQRSEFEAWQDRKNLKIHISMGQMGENRVLLIKPTTFMNLSGDAVLLTANFFKIPPSQIVVAYDDIDINFGHIKTAMGGSSAGHNGIKSIINTMGENFGRIRIGTGPKTPEQIDSADFVLQKFNKSELEQIPKLKKEVVSILIEYIYSNQINTGTRTFLI
jgi:PTH1 family peptidyl-tRNA hydrolase